MPIIKRQFRFNSNIICDIGANIDNAEVFKSFAEEERYFSLSALVNLKEQIGVGGVYFDSVNEVASRINANNYVPNGALLFNEDAIDELLERIIIGNQASIKEASNFADLSKHLSTNGRSICLKVTLQNSVKNSN